MPNGNSWQEVEDRASGSTVTKERQTGVSRPKSQPENL